MKTVIGIVGEKGSGKETCAEFLAEYLSSSTIAHIRSSDILAETLKLWDLPLTRHNLQQQAIVMDQGFGIGTLTHAVKTRINSLTADIILFDGVRWQSDADMIRSFPKNLLIYVTATIETRYTRTKARKEKIGEAFATYEMFVEQEKVLTELDIPKIGATADVIIDNNGSLEEYKKQVGHFCSTYLK